MLKKNQNDSSCTGFGGGKDVKSALGDFKQSAEQSLLK